MRLASILTYFVLTTWHLAAAEMRGIWVDAFRPGFHSKEEVKRLVADCRKYNFNAVFVQMRKRGDAYYIPKAPNQEPRASDIVPDFDALQEIIAECHSGSPQIQVHCWVVGYYIWAWNKPPTEKAHVYNRHPEWLTKDSIGQTVVGQGYFLDPGNPEANRYLLNVAEDLVSCYDIDGLHWDYLRYPLQDSGYNEEALKRFREEAHISEKPRPNDPKFCDWRRKQVTDFVRLSTAELHGIKPKLVISAAVFANYADSYEIRLADWVSWNKEGIIDAVAPMNFTPDNRFTFEPRCDFAFTNQWKSTVWMGQGAYYNEKENTIRQLHYCRSKGFSGTILYSYDVPSKDSVPAETAPEDIFPGLAQVTIDNRKAEIVGTWKNGHYGKFYGDDYIFSSECATNAVTFKPVLPENGDYTVYEWHVAGTNRANAVPHVIISGVNTNTVLVDQRNCGEQWNNLGKFHFCTNTAAVRVLSTNTNGVTVADAMRFVLQTNSDFSVMPKDNAAQNRIRALSFIEENYRPTGKYAP